MHSDRWNRDQTTGRILPGAHGSRRPRAGMPLSPRERQILTLLSKGHTRDAIMKRLYLTDGAVNNFLLRARQKLEAATTAEAIAVAERSGQLGPTRHDAREAA